MVAIRGFFPQLAFLQGGGSYADYGVDQFLNPEMERLRADELRQFSQAINGSGGFKDKDVQKLAKLMETLKQMPNGDLLSLLAMLSPEIRKMLMDAFSRSAMGEDGGGSASGGGGPSGGGGLAGGGGGSSGGGGAPVGGGSSGGGSSRGGGSSNVGGAGRSSSGSKGGGAPVSGPAPSGPAPGGTGAGAKLARTAEQVARSTNTVGWCYRGVSNAVSQALGVRLTGASAYMAADQLAGNSRFKEVKVSPDQLKKLPPGAIVVWGKTAASPHGHISVALGDGREASDHIQQQMSSLRGATNYRVFIPQG